VSENQKKITYLFGAGASANILPVVAEIPNRLREFHKELEDKTELYPQPNERFNNSLVQRLTKFEYFKEMLEKIKWLEDETRNHASVDTLAKKFYLTKYDRYLLELKAVMSVFFLWEQKCRPADPRYDTLIASIGDLEKESIKLPFNLRVLSWNYDFQFEKAFSQFSTMSTLSSIQERLNVVPRKGKLEAGQGFSMFKLNGTTSVEDSEKEIQPMSEEMHAEKDSFLVEDLTWIHSSLLEINRVRPTLNFAWENDNIQKKVLELARVETRDTEILVVIGYSFPFFNRVTDRSLIRSMTELKTVYFQAKDIDVDANIERFRSIRPDFAKDQLIWAKGIDQFFLPPEL
jgi:hypothetical protein